MEPIPALETISPYAWPYHSHAIFSSVVNDYRFPMSRLEKLASQSSELGPPLEANSLFMGYTRVSFSILANLMRWSMTATTKLLKQMTRMMTQIKDT
jgi:hypothetical protein